MSVVVRRMITGFDFIFSAIAGANAHNERKKMGMGAWFAIAAVMSVLICSVASPERALAAKVEDLYKTEVPVNSQSEKDRKEAMGKALGQVLVNVTGETGSLANQKLKEAMSEPDGYVKGYSYRKDATSESRQQYLHVSFVEGGVKKLLREAGLAIWGDNRPTTLTWLAIDDGQSRNIQRGVANDSLVQSLENRFSSRALPLIFPLMDFEDAQVLSPVDVWGLFTSKLESASKRYGADSVLAGRLTVNGGIYNGRLSLIFRGHRQDAEVSGLNEEQLSLVAADLVGSTLSRHYAIASVDTGGHSVLVVEQVNTVRAYAALIDYLEKLTAVRTVKVRRVAGAVVELELTIDGYASQLADAIALGRKLRPAQPAQGKELADVASTLHYRWIGQ